MSSRRRGRNPEGTEDGFDFAVGHVRAHHAEQLGPRKREVQWFAVAGVQVHRAGEDFAARELHQQCGAAARSGVGHFRIGAALEAHRGFGAQVQMLGRAANRNGIEPGGFEQNVMRRGTDFAFRAAHHAGNGHGVRGVGDHAYLRRKRALEAVERADLFSGVRAAHDDAAIDDARQIESVQRLAQLEHDVIGGVDNVVDRRLPEGFEPLPQPGRRRLNFYAAHDSRRVAAA